MARLPYALWRVNQRRRWYKLYVEGTERVHELQERLKGCAGDYMTKVNSDNIRKRKAIAVLIADDEDFLLIKMGMKFYDDEIKGYGDWGRYYPTDSRYRRCLIGRTTREPHPMAR